MRLYELQGFTLVTWLLRTEVFRICRGLSYCGGCLILHLVEFMVTEMIPKMAFEVAFTLEDHSQIA